MKDKLKKITKVNNDAEYLRGEYESIKLWGSSPNGDIEFPTLLEWVTENKHVVEHMIAVGELVKDIDKAT